MIGLAPSTYYYQPKRDPLLKLRSDTELRDLIERIQLSFPGYGWRRVQKLLFKQGRKVNHTHWTPEANSSRSEGRPPHLFEVRSTEEAT
jgi:hypothetical protein